MQVSFGNYSIVTKIEREIQFIYDIIRKKWIVLSPEEQVRQVWIHYLVHDCHISESKIAVERGVTINGRQKRFDICIYGHDLLPFLLIECKSPKIMLKSKTYEQISAYNIHLKCNNFIITNGIQHLGMKIMDNKVQSIHHIAEIL